MSSKLSLSLLAGLLLVGVHAAGGCIPEETESGRFDDDDGSGGAAAAQTTVSAGGSDAVTTTITTTVSAGPTTNAQASTTTTTTGSGNTCPPDSDEPNDNETNAVYLGTLSDCADPVGFSGVLSGDDVDWFMYDGIDNFGCWVAPGRTISSDAQARICKFIECEGATAICPDGTTAETSPQGRPGCCGLTSFEVDVECDPTDDSAAMYLRIDKPPAFDCVSYSVDFYF